MVLLFESLSNYSLGVCVCVFFFFFLGGGGGGGNKIKKK